MTYSATDPPAVSIEPSDDSLCEVLAAFAPIGLAEMEQVSLMNRVDTKYLLGANLLPRLFELLIGDYRVLECEGQRLTQYVTLYFDTPRRDCYLAHHNGQGNRWKYRMRTYHSSGASFFEVKHRTNKNRTDKRRMAIAGIGPAMSPATAEFAEASTGRHLQLVPQIWTLFRRATLVSISEPERVTIDVGITFHSGNQQAEIPGQVVIEVKQERDRRYTPIRRHLRELAVRPVSMSKYCIGSVLLDPHLKRNHFKQQLQALTLGRVPLTCQTRPTLSWNI